MTRYRADDLTADAQQLLCAAGLAETHARHLAQAIVAADLLGFSSHGLALLPRYLDELADGRIAKTGDAGDRARQRIEPPYRRTHAARRGAWSTRRSITCSAGSPHRAA